jgi:hypothetical protein
LGEIIAKSFKVKLEKTVTTSFEAKPAKTVTTGFDAKPPEPSPPVLKPNRRKPSE